MTRPVIVIGAGGHGKVVAATLLAMGEDVLGFADGAPVLVGKSVLGLPVLGGDEIVHGRGPEAVRLAMGIGSVGSTALRRRLFDAFVSAGFEFVGLLHPLAVTAPGLIRGEGAQVMAGAVLQPDVWLGRNAVVNTGACVDHDCRLGDHCHIAPGAVLCGGVNVGAGAHVGSGATLLQGIEIGAEAVIGAGAVVLGSVPIGAVVVGNPAREMAGR